jgi:glycerophosphoryl diester phosphodiesterase
VGAGVPRLEVDVRFLADDTPVVFHDAVLDGDTNATGPVEQLDRAAARSVRLRAPGDHPIPVLADVADLVRDGSSLLQVDLKPLLPLTGGQLRHLADTLRPIRAQALVGSMAHYSVRHLAAQGFRVALDPTLHWHFNPDRKPGTRRDPARLGQFGLWDDAPVAHIAGVRAADYFAARIDDLAGLCPAVEWMVDIRTIEHLSGYGFALGDRIAAKGIELAAWTVRDRGAAETGALLDRLFALGTTTVITDHATTVARYVTH